MAVARGGVVATGGVPPDMAGVCPLSWPLRRWLVGLREHGSRACPAGRGGGVRPRLRSCLVAREEQRVRAAAARIRDDVLRRRVEERAPYGRRRRAGVRLQVERRDAGG